MIGKRQFQIADLRTGDITVVWWPVVTYPNKHGYVNTNPRPGYTIMCREVSGLEWMRECSVSLVPDGQEISLPFDEIPLVIRQPHA